MFDPLKIDPLNNPSVLEETETSPDALWATQQAEQVVVGTVTGYLQSVIASQEKLTEEARAKGLSTTRHSDTASLYRRMLANKSTGPISAAVSAGGALKGTKIASHSVTAAEALACLPPKTQRILKDRKATLDQVIDDVINETWGKEGEMLSQEELEARALKTSMDAGLGIDPASKPASTLEIPGAKITLAGYIQNFVDKKTQEASSRRESESPDIDEESLPS